LSLLGFSSWDLDSDLRVDLYRRRRGSMYIVMLIMLMIMLIRFWNAMAGDRGVKLVSLDGGWGVEESGE
jgi:hypothetical protein